MALVSAVILGHVFITYGDIGSWAYREPSDNDAFLIVAALVVSLGSLFAMGLFFLIAGLLTPRSLAKKGTRGFVRDRVVRLGVPFLAYLVLYPLVVWLAGDESWSAVASGQLREWTPGPLWFVLVLMIYSAGYAWWRARHPAHPSGGPLRPRLLVGLAAAIGASTVLVRLVFPINSDQIFSLHLWQWPQCLGLFVLGVACAENGWADPVPARTRRGCWVRCPGRGAGDGGRLRRQPGFLRAVRRWMALAGTADRGVRGDHRGRAVDLAARALPAPS